MPCLSLDGLIYPCFRWLPILQPDGTDPKVAISGDVNTGIWFPGAVDLILEKSKRSECTKDPKWLKCEYEPCYPFCIGGCYAEFGDFIRTTHIYEITKLQAKWTETYWREYESLENVGYLSKRYLTIRESFDSSRQTLLTALPDVPNKERHNFYVNAFRDLCDQSVALASVVEEIFTTHGILGFEKVELNEIYIL